MVRDQGVEPSTIMLHIEDGSTLQDRTFHAETRYQGRSISQTRTFHDNASYHGWFGIQGLEPSTLRLNITDGPYLRSEPSTLKVDFVDSSM